MADDPSCAHHAAIHGLISAAVPYAVFLDEVTVPDGGLTFPYLVVWSAPGARPVTTHAGYASEVTTATRVTAAGRDAAEVLAALDRAATAIHRVIPTIAGRRPSPITQDPASGAPLEVEKDPTVRTADGRPVYYALLRFNLMSTRLS